MRRILAVLLLLVFVLPAAAKDPNAWVRVLGEKKSATVADGVRLVAMLAGYTGGENGAQAYLLKKGILQKAVTETGLLSKGCLSLMIMRAKNYKGGLFYSLFKSGRYAYRELVYKGFLPAGGSEHGRVSGGLLLAVIAKVRGDVDLKIGGAK